MSTSQALKAVATRTAESPKETLLQSLLHQPFNADAWHAMDERDNALIRDNIEHGAASKAFVYEFKIGDKMVTGVSVIGARELVSQYGGIKAHIAATVEKRGALFIFRTFSPLEIKTVQLHDLSDETDFYECVMEISDIKTGNSIQVRKKETKTERKSNGGSYDRPHYDVIAESKAFRNGVLSLLPQGVIAEFKRKCLEKGNSSTEQTIDQIRAGALAFAAKSAIPINRNALGGLTWAEINGLGSAAKISLEAFKQAAAALGLMGGAETEGTGQAGAATAPPPPPAAPEPKKPAKAGKQAAPPPSEGDGTEPPAKKKTYAEYADMILKAGDADSAAVFLDQARQDLDEQLCGELGQVYRNKWEAA